MRAALACLILSAPLAQPLAARTLMTAEEFDRFSLGRTLDYATEGQVRGSEAYFEGRRVRDADSGGPCFDGIWFPQGDAICFLYPAREGLHCWHYWREGDRVLAQPLSIPDAPPQEVTEAASPLACPGPDVGV